MPSILIAALRSQLGTVVSAVLRAARELDEDPISAHHGVYPNPMPILHRVAALHGWTLADMVNELEDRGISEKWQYVNGITEIIAMLAFETTVARIQAQSRLN